jgi:hypothetical protein
MNNIEILGWVATGFIILSFLQKDIIKLRTLSMIGAILWTLYGFILESYSIVFLNFAIIGIQLYWIIKGKS